MKKSVLKNKRSRTSSKKTGFPKGIAADIVDALKKFGKIVTKIPDKTQLNEKDKKICRIYKIIF